MGTTMTTHEVDKSASEVASKPAGDVMGITELRAMFDDKQNPLMLKLFEEKLTAHVWSLQLGASSDEHFTLDSGIQHLKTNPYTDPALLLATFTGKGKGAFSFNAIGRARRD